MIVNDKSKIKVKNINSLDCYKNLKEINNAKLIDVRTESEWRFVGVPDLTAIEKKTIFISWQFYPKMNRNNDFHNEIVKFKIKKDDLIFIICRSGSRSLSAAQYLTTLNYKKCINVCDGFEGSKDSNSHRSQINGWKYNQLPWKQ